MRGRPRLLFVAPTAYTLGGIANWLDTLAPSLISLGWEVVVGLVRGPRYHLPERYLAKHPFAETVSIVAITGTAVGRRLSLQRAIAHTRPDLVVGVNIPDTYPAVNALRARSRQAPHVAMALHGIQPDLYEDLRRYSTVLDGLICTNRLAAALAAGGSGFDANRAYYAPCGVGPGVQSKQPASGVFRIAWVGRLEQDQKRIMDLIELVSILDRLGFPYRLSIVGSGPQETALRRGLSVAERAGRVHFLGELTPEYLRETFYPNQDALLITSAWETGPIVAWEAMAAGVPVVSARYIGSGLEAALLDNVTALMFEIADMATAAQKLQTLAMQPGLRVALVAAGVDLVQRRYSVTASAAAWDRAFRSVLTGSTKVHDPHLQEAVEAGRLNAWFGPVVAEYLRTVLRRKAPDSGPGGEWPHSHGSAPHFDADFWRQARLADRAMVGGRRG